MTNHFQHYNSILIVNIKFLDNHDLFSQDLKYMRLNYTNLPILIRTLNKSEYILIKLVDWSM